MNAVEYLLKEVGRLSSVLDQTRSNTKSLEVIVKIMVQDIEGIKGDVKDLQDRVKKLENQ